MGSNSLTCTLDNMPWFMAFRNVLRKDRAMVGVGATEDDDESVEW